MASDDVIKAQMVVDQNVEAAKDLVKATIDAHPDFYGHVRNILMMPNNMESAAKFNALEDQDRFYALSLAIPLASLGLQMVALSGLRECDFAEGQADG